MSDSERSLLQESLLNLADWLKRRIEVATEIGALIDATFPSPATPPEPPEEDAGRQPPEVIPAPSACDPVLRNAVSLDDFARCRVDPMKLSLFREVVALLRECGHEQEAGQIMELCDGTTEGAGRTLEYVERLLADLGPKGGTL